MPLRLRWRASAKRLSRTTASLRMTRKSAFTLAEMLGRCTLTATSSPVSRVARCTCAIEAAASGSWLKGGKEFFGGCTQLLHDDGPHVRIRRTAAPHFAARPAPLTHSSGRFCDLRRDHLSELDIGGAQFLQQQAHLGRRAQAVERSRASGDPDFYLVAEPVDGRRRQCDVQPIAMDGAQASAPCARSPPARRSPTQGCARTTAR